MNILEKSIRYLTLTWAHKWHWWTWKDYRHQWHALFPLLFNNQKDFLQISHIKPFSIGLRLSSEQSGRSPEDYYIHHFNLVEGRKKIFCNISIHINQISKYCLRWEFSGSMWNLTWKFKFQLSISWNFRQNSSCDLDCGSCTWLYVTFKINREISGFRSLWMPLARCVIYITNGSPFPFYHLRENFIYKKLSHILYPLTSEFTIIS